MDADEPRRVQSRLEAAHPLGDEQPAPRHVQPRVVVVGLDPIDVGHGDERDPPAGTHLDPLRVPGVYSRRLGGPLRERGYCRDAAGGACRLEGVDQARRTTQPHVLLRAADRLAQAPLAEGLQDVVERPDLEGTERVHVVRRHEDHRRHGLVAQLAEHAEAVQVGDLHVEEHHVRPARHDAGDGVGPAPRLAHQLDLGVAGEHEAYPFAGQRLVVDDEDPDSPWHGGTHDATSGGSHGSSTCTTHPPPGALPMMSRWRSP